MIVERAGKNGYFVFLDWQKAFDRVKQSKLMEALRRLDIAEELILRVEALYRSPYFTVNVEGSCSSRRRQNNGIRQGTISPYLFICLMTILFEDIHDDRKSNAMKARPPGLDFGE